MQFFILIRIHYNSGTAYTFVLCENQIFIYQLEATSVISNTHYLLTLIN